MAEIRFLENRHDVIFNDKVQDTNRYQRTQRTILAHFVVFSWFSVLCWNFFNLRFCCFTVLFIANI